jgi:PAS domain S-box-containing protein
MSTSLETTPPRLAFSLPLDPSRLLRARQRIRDYLVEHQVDADAIDAVVLTIEEAMTNAVRHSGTSQDIDIGLHFEGSDLVAEVKDHGRGFDVATFDPDRMPDLLAPCGRGLYLIAKLMDEMELRQDGGLEVWTLKRDVLAKPAQAVGRAADLHVRVPGAGDYRDARQMALLEEIEESFIALDWEYRYAYVNEAALRMAEQSREDMTGRRPWDLWPAFKSTKLSEAIRDAMEFGRFAVIEYQTVVTDEWVEARVYPTSSGVSVFSRDITQRKRRELEGIELTQALRESEASYTAIFEKSPFAIALSRLPENVIVNVNQAFLDLFEYTLEEVQGKTSAELGIADEASRAQVAEELRTAGRVRDFEVVRRTKSGARRIVSLSIDWVSVRGRQHVLTTVHDVTAQKQAEAALQQNNEQLAATLEELQATEEELRATEEELRDNNDALLSAHEVLQETEQRVRHKLESVLSPEGDIGWLELADLIDLPTVQKLMEDFYRLAHIPMAILDIEGRVLVGVGWQDICTQFHRVQAQTASHCLESDTQLSAGLAQGESHLYKCRNNLWDMATPIVVGDHHVGNIFIGQFFFEDEDVDRELFRAQARRYGFDEEEYLAALDCVPRLSREAVDRGMAFFVKLAATLSQLGHSNFKLARSLAERDRLNAALRDSDERFRLVLRNAPVSVAAQDRDLSYVWAYNQRSAGPEQIIGKRDADLFTPEEAERLAAIKRRVLDEDLEIREQMWLGRPGGRMFLDVSFEPLHDEAGRVTGVGSATVDVTPMKLVEEALSQSRAELLAALESMTDAVYVSDVEGNFLDFNEAFATFHRFKSKQEASRVFADYPDILDVFFPDGTPAPLDRWAVPRALRGETATNQEYILRRKDTGETWVGSYSLSPIRDEHGDITGSVVVGRDVSEQKRAEEELRKLYEQQRSIATTLQQSFIHPLPKLAHVELGLVEAPAWEPGLIGGDFWDLFELPDRRVVALVGDVAGKGVTAAALTETVRSTMRAFAQVDGMPAFILRKTNEMLLARDSEELFVTALVLVLDPMTGHLSVASAGHPAPVLLASRSCSILEPPYGSPLGSFVCNYASADFRLASDDCLLLYTDGVTEARQGRELFGERRLLETVRELRGRSCEEIAQAVRQAAESFGGKLWDDLDALVLRLK